VITIFKNGINEIMDTQLVYPLSHYKYGKESMTHNMAKNESIIICLEF